MPRPLGRFLKDQIGTVSVDWVVLAFGVICLGALAIGTAADGTFGLADSVADSVQSNHTVHTEDQSAGGN